MTKRSDIRQHYQTEANQAAHNQQFQDRTAQLNALEDTVINAFNTLIRFIDGKTTKTEVVNQLKSISTPDVDKVVTAISKLDKDILANKLDIKPLEQGLNSLKRELSLIPKSLPKIPEQKDKVAVTNLKEIKLDTTPIEKAIKALKLDVDVKAPIINVDAPNLKPLQDVMLDIIKAISKIELPEVPTTDLKTLETEAKTTNKKLDEANKHLKKIVDKPVGGGGGGGGNGTPYQDSSGTFQYVQLQGGSIPVVNPDGSNIGGGGLTDAELRATPVEVQDDTANTILAQLQSNTEALQELAVVMKVLQQATVNPPHIDKSLNAVRVQQQGTISASVSTITTLTNLTNIGSYTGTMQVWNNNTNSWANVVRRNIT